MQNIEELIRIIKDVRKLDDHLGNRLSMYILNELYNEISEYSSKKREVMDNIIYFRNHNK
ncbi:MAG: hypothetical protein IJK61_03805 [Bacteroidetes bacterium]|nr:hypothetical protein [Bacteroidota bacterium]